LFALDGALRLLGQHNDIDAPIDRIERVLAV